jgi:hypothetical protein
MPVWCGGCAHPSAGRPRKSPWRDNLRDMAAQELDRKDHKLFLFATDKDTWIADNGKIHAEALREPVWYTPTRGESISIFG